MKQSLYTPQDIFAEARNEAEVSNLLNTDAYKIFMLDFILANPEYRNLKTRRDLTIRTPGIQTASVIPQESLERQLSWTKAIAGISESDAQYLKHMTTATGEQRLRDETIKYLQHLTLSDYEIGIDENNNYTLRFEGTRADSMMREIYGLKIINSLYLYHYTQKAQLSEKEFDQIIQTTIDRLYEDIGIFQSEPGLKFMEFGTRRGMSTDFHRIVYHILRAEAPEQCVGSSNIMISMEHNEPNAKGTNAHELRMIPLALIDDPEELVAAMYDIDRQRAHHHPDLAILLPDTYGTSFYLDHCPDDIAQLHTGNRIDSKDPHEAIPEYISFLHKHNIDPQTKAALPSDGLTAHTSVDITRKHKANIGTLISGNGTHLTNNTKGTRPREQEPYGPFGSFSVVIKPSQVQRPDGTRAPCIKLSDNRNKITGQHLPGGTERIELLKKTFGTAGATTTKVSV